MTVPGHQMYRMLSSFGWYPGPPKHPTFLGQLLACDTRRSLHSQLALVQRMAVSSEQPCHPLVEGKRPPRTCNIHRWLKKLKVYKHEIIHALSLNSLAILEELFCWSANSTAATSLNGTNIIQPCRSYSYVGFTQRPTGGNVLEAYSEVEICVPFFLNTATASLVSGVSRHLLPGVWSRGGPVPEEPVLPRWRVQSKVSDLDCCQKPVLFSNVDGPWQPVMK